MTDDEMRSIALEAFISYDDGVAENARDSVGNVAEGLGVLLNILITKDIITKAEASSVLSAPAFSFIDLEELE